MLTDDTDDTALAPDTAHCILMDRILACLLNQGYYQEGINGSTVESWLVMCRDVKWWLTSQSLKIHHRVSGRAQKRVLLSHDVVRFVFVVMFSPR